MTGHTFVAYSELDRKTASELLVQLTNKHPNYHVPAEDTYIVSVAKALQHTLKFLCQSPELGIGARDGFAEHLKVLDRIIERGGE